MAGTKLNLVIDSYLETPYWRNIVDQVDGRIIAEGPFDGKGTPEQIKYATLCAAEKEDKDYNTMSKEEIQELQKRNNIGIECSGLIYNLLDGLCKDMGLSGVYYHLVGEWRGIKRFGVRSVSASHMAMPVNSSPIRTTDLMLGDIVTLMGHDEIGHVILILKNENNILNVIHNSSSSSYPFVHTFNIKITDPNKNIIHQDWQEKSISGGSYLNEFNLSHPITGSYRPNFLLKK